jgi:hypothetical protein
MGRWRWQTACTFTSSGGNQMNNIVKNLFLGGALALGTMGTAIAAPQGSTPPPSQEQPKQTQKQEKVEGSVVSVDAKARTVTVKEMSGEKTFEVNSKAKISRAGKAITLNDVKAGDKVTGYAHQAQGKEMLDSLMIGA